MEACVGAHPGTDQPRPGQLSTTGHKVLVYKPSATTVPYLNHHTTVVSQCMLSIHGLRIMAGISSLFLTQ